MSYCFLFFYFKQSFMVDDCRRILGSLNFPEKALSRLSQKRVFSYLNSYKQYSIILYALQAVVKYLAKVFYVVGVLFFFFINSLFPRRPPMRRGSCMSSGHIYILTA